MDVLDERHETSKNATPFQVKVSAGDVLFIPTAWWHEVRSLSTPSISVSHWFVDQSNLIPEIEDIISSSLALYDGKESNVFVDCVKQLIQYSKPNYITSSTETILQIAVLFHFTESVRLLLESPLIKPNYTLINSAFTPFFLVIKFGYFDLLDLFIKHKDIDVNAVFPNSGYSPLTLAAAEGHTKIFNRLIAAGANPHACDQLGRFPTII